jgi:hypothetical protein
VPRGFDLRRQLSCSMSSSTTSIHSSSRYQTSLLADASLSGSSWGFAFSASVDYQRARENVDSSAYTRYETTTVCSLYSAQTLPFTTILTAPFRAGVAFLTAVYDVTKYRTFVESFGTHCCSWSQIHGCPAILHHGLEAHVGRRCERSGSSPSIRVSATTDVTWHQSDYQTMSNFTFALSRSQSAIYPRVYSPARARRARRARLAKSTLARGRFLFIVLLHLGN